MNLRLIPSLCLLCIVGCSSAKNESHHQKLSNGQIINNGIALSEYFEAKKYTANEEVLVHLIVTLGTERIPKGQELALSWQDKKLKDRIEEVEEVYISNKSERPIEIENARLTYFSTSRSLVENKVTIQPNSFYKTQALIASTSLYRAEKNRILIIKINGVEEVINLKERRTPVLELGENI
ncbi:hypothetical protein SAMN05660691_04131 [Rheinheimera pacifica]|uniref:Uncharacterized protein n=1 Tax=Rheinheimera pacifica TaxID=173990 RepID=A0A1H6NKX7_9GAMM|nr:hypothetical protein [Rheinheimera pacifica]SEI13825.1 hypothetical protein SAMN05660691_04131 [Rheinheimera pacifica]